MKKTRRFRQKGRLTEGPVGHHLARLAMPTAWGVCMVMSIGLADIYFLAKFGERELAAISYALPVQLILTSAAMGFATATNALVSPPLGNGDEARAQARASAALALAAGAGFLIAGFGIVTARPLFAIMGATGETLDLIVVYMRIWYPSFVLLALAMVGNAVMRAWGDAIRPATVMTVAALSNIALAPVFIFGLAFIPEFGMAGAAIATVVARITMFVILAAFLSRELTLRVPRWRLNAAIWSRLVRFGLPAAGSNVINPVGIAAVTAALSSMSDEAVSAFGIASRIQLMAIVPLLALSTAIGPVIGQNFGANLKPRVNGALLVAISAVIIYGSLLTILLYFGGGWLAALFTESAAINDVIALYMRILPASLIAYGAMIVMIGALTAVGRPIPGLIAAVIRTGIVTIPGAFLVAPLGYVWPVFATIAIGNLVGGAIALIAGRQANLFQERQTPQNGR